MNEIISKLKPDSINFQKKYIERVQNSKNRSLSFLDYLHDQGLPFSSVNTASNVANCSSWLKFRHYEDDKNVLHDARFCKKDKLCSACAMRRATKQVLKVNEQLKHYPALKTGYWYYIVIPVRHNEGEHFTEVHARLKRVLKSINQSMRDGKRNKSFNVFSTWEGTMTSEEFTKSKNGWNVHANILVHTLEPLELIYSYTSDHGTKYYYNKDISLLLEKYSGNGSYRHTVNSINIKKEDDLIRSLQEIFKYALKFSDLNNEDLAIAYFSTEGKRLLATSGSLRGIKFDVTLKEEDRADILFYEVLYSYASGQFGFGKEDQGNIRKGKSFKNGWTIYEETKPYDHVNQIGIDQHLDNWEQRRDSETDISNYSFYFVPSAKSFQFNFSHPDPASNKKLLKVFLKNHLLK